ncbi:MAG: hypothetical protein WBM04_19375 [Candidatus Korobacteraceae bacterium]
MRRSLLLVLLIPVLSAGLLQAQRAGGGFHGGGMQGGRNIRPGPSNGFFPGRFGGHHHEGFGYGRYGYGSVWLPGDFGDWDDDYFGWEPSYQQQPAAPTLPQVIVLRSKERETPALTPEPPKVIEVSQSKDPVARPQPATLFVLKNGERLESHDYVLTVQSLQIEVGRQRRTIPINSLDLDATIAANQSRGIEVTIPPDRNTVFVGF